MKTSESYQPIPIADTAPPSPSSSLSPRRDILRALTAVAVVAIILLALTGPHRTTSHPYARYLPVKVPLERHYHNSSRVRSLRRITPSFPSRKSSVLPQMILCAIILALWDFGFP